MNMITGTAMNRRIDDFDVKTDSFLKKKIIRTFDHIDKIIFNWIYSFTTAVN